MANIKPADLGDAIAQELTIYHEDVLNQINQLGEEAIKKVVKKTKVTAPEKTGDFRKRIASKVIPGPRGNENIWYVKAPDHRITHLLVHGHAKQNGGRVPGDPFLQNALDEVLPDYEKNVEEALKG